MRSVSSARELAGIKSSSCKPNKSKKFNERNKPDKLNKLNKPDELNSGLLP